MQHYQLSIGPRISIIDFAVTKSIVTKEITDARSQFQNNDTFVDPKFSLFFVILPVINTSLFLKIEDKRRSKVCLKKV